MTVHHGLRAAAGSSGGGGGLYGNPKLNYDYNYASTNYWTGGSWQLYTHSGTPVTGNGSTGWTNEGPVSVYPTTTGLGTSWRTVDYIDLSSYSGKWAMFMYAWNQPSYWQADILFDNFEYEDDGGTIAIPGSANTVAAWQDYWVGYLGAANNLNNSSTWPLDTANQSNRYSLAYGSSYGKWNLRNSSTPSGSTGNVGTSNGYFVYYESSLNGTSSTAGFYNGTNQHSRRILLSKHAYYIGDYSQTPILYTP